MQECGLINPGRETCVRGTPDRRLRTCAPPNSSRRDGHCRVRWSCDVQKLISSQQQICVRQYPIKIHSLPISPIKSHHFDYSMDHMRTGCPNCIQRICIHWITIGGSLDIRSTRYPSDTRSAVDPTDIQISGYPGDNRRTSHPQSIHRIS